MYIEILTYKIIILGQFKSKLGGHHLPKLFAAILESIRRINWVNKVGEIDGEFLNTLRFADGIFLGTETPQ